MIEETTGDKIVRAYIARAYGDDKSMSYHVGTLQSALALTIDDIQIALEALKQRDYKLARKTLERRLARFTETP